MKNGERFFLKLKNSETEKLKINLSNLASQ